MVKLNIANMLTAHQYYTGHANVQFATNITFPKQAVKVVLKYEFGSPNTVKYKCIIADKILKGYNLSVYGQ